MRRAKILVAASLLAVAMPALAEQPVMQRVLPMDTARDLAAATVAKCRKDGFKVAVAVVDRGGRLLAFLRDDGAGPHTIEAAQRKAFTSVTFRSPSAVFAKRVAENPAASALADLEGVIALGGGLPIMAGGDVIGGVGVGGAPGGDKDEACAKAGLDSIAAALK